MSKVTSYRISPCDRKNSSKMLDCQCDMRTFFEFGDFQEKHCMLQFCFGVILKASGFVTRNYFRKHVLICRKIIRNLKPLFSLSFTLKYADICYFRKANYTNDSISLMFTYELIETCKKTIVHPNHQYYVIVLGIKLSYFVYIIFLGKIDFYFSIQFLKLGLSLF